jgi:hypothetical protein
MMLGLGANPTPTGTSCPSGYTYQPAYTVGSETVDASCPLSGGSLILLFSGGALVARGITTDNVWMAIAGGALIAYQFAEVLS